MSISLLGVVGLQLYWINNAIKVKQEQFDRSVNEALTKVVEKLETREAVSVVNNQVAALRPYAPLLPHDTTTRARQAAAVKAPKLKNEIKERSPATQPRPASVRVLSAKPEATTAKILHPSSVTSISAAAPIAIYVDTNGAVRLPLQHPMLVDSQGVYSDLLKLNDANTTYISLNSKLKSSTIAATKVDSVFAASFEKGATYHFGEKADSAAFKKLFNRSALLSMDTLKFMAHKLDSLPRIDISSIEVRHDSIFIYRKGNRRPVYFRQSAPVPDRTVWRQATSPTQSVPLQAAAPARQAKPAESLRNTKHTPDISKIEVKKEKLQDVVQQMVVEYAVKDEPLQQRINLNYLQSLLKMELQSQGIGLDFGYWVVANQNDTIAAHNLQSLHKPALPRYKASLFPNDIFQKSDYVGLYFPGSKAYALKSLWGMLSLSALFTLIIIATFCTTIYIILRQKKLSEMKNDFINNMTHEFKTPIATISLATDSIANPKVYGYPEKVQYYTNIIRQENKRMNAQVENVLQIALLDKNDFKMNLQQVDVHELIMRATESIQLQVAQRLGRISVQLNALHHELQSDEMHLYNVICNLLDNANKYSPDSPDIKLITQNIDRGILIAVEDKGMGMSQDAQQRVFEKFYRVPTGNLHNVKGFGLGLSYVKAIVLAHHGQVRLKSEPGKGSRFEVYLPM